MTFLPEGYQVPVSGSNYMKFEEGENVFRVLGSAITGWEDWEDKKPMRFKFDNKPSKSIDPTKPVKHFWAFPVWNYAKSAVQILEITQVGIQNAISGLVNDTDWGDPKEYDIKVTRKGEKLDTEYQVSPRPKKEILAEALEAYKGLSINLEALFTGDDPFEEIATIDLSVKNPFDSM